MGLTLFERWWLLTSQAINTFAFQGDPDESLSARCWRQREIPSWESMRQRIDKYLGDGHCQRVREAQVKREKARG